MFAEDVLYFIEHKWTKSIVKTKENISQVSNNNKMFSSLKGWGKNISIAGKEILWRFPAALQEKTDLTKHWLRVGENKII